MAVRKGNVTGKVDEGVAVAVVVAAAVEGKVGKGGAAVRRRARNASEAHTNYLVSKILINVVCYY